MDLDYAIGYYRVSTLRQEDEGHALERYREDLLSFGIKEENLYWDIESGGSAGREGFNKALAACREWATTIAIPDLSRFNRSVLLWENVRPELVSLGIQLIDIYTLKVEDLTTAEGIRDGQLKTVHNEYTRNYAAQQSIRGHARRRRMKKPLVACFGYKVVKDKLLINDDKYKNTGKSYREIALEYIEVFLETRSYSKTVRIMCDRYGYDRTHNKGEDFPTCHTGARYWLINEVLAGHQVYFPTGRTTRKSIFQEAVTSQIIYNNHEPLITPELGARIIDTVNSIVVGKKPNAAVNPLAGMLYCSACGSRMIRKRCGNRNHRQYLYCSGAYPRAGKQRVYSLRSSGGLQVQDAVESVIGFLVSKRNEIANWVDVPLEATVDPKILELQSQLNQLKLIPNPSEPIVAAIGSIQKEIDDTLYILSIECRRDESTKKLLLESFGDPDYWQSLTSEQQKVVYFRLIERIMIKDGGVEEVVLKL